MLNTNRVNQRSINDRGVYGASERMMGKMAKNSGRAWDINNDGELQLIESAFHYRNGNGTPITVEGSKVSLRGLDPDLFSGKKAGYKVSQNLIFIDFFGEGTIYGRLSFRYLGGNKVQIESNKYDFDTGAAKGHPWFGTGSEFWRNVATKLGNVVN